MSIVEKAAERLKNLQADAPSGASPEGLPQDEPKDASPVATTIERSREKITVTEPSEETREPWHVDFAALRRSGLLPMEKEAENRLGDELRRVKRPILDNAGSTSGAQFYAHANRILVTSAVPGEGKTFTAMNLALSLAREPDFEVLLVDSDIPKANITRVLGLDKHIGLMDVLVDETHQPVEAIVDTDVPRLKVVPTGKRHALTAELFRSRRMQYVLESLGGRNRQRLVVFDSSPLLATSESQVIASHMGQVVMVVAAGRTRQQELKVALQSVNESQYVGLVLNKSRLPASENHYYSYYSNYYSADPDEEA